LDKVIAERLRPGDRVGIVAPSAPILEGLEAQFQRGLEFLRDLGLEPIPGRHLFSRSLGYAASPEEKLEDLYGFFADPAIKALICAQGGDTANACLSGLDWEVIRKHPKIFMGRSDNTVLLNALYQMTGLITFHGHDVLWGFGKRPTAYDRQEFISRLMRGETGKIPPSAERRTVRGGSAEGRLLGGNLRCLLKLAGTPFFPNLEGAVLFLESFTMTPERCDYLLRQLMQMGVWDRIVGAVIGYIHGLERQGGSGPPMEDLLKALTPKHPFPILKVRDFGHACPNTVLPVGALVRLDADRQEIEILEPFLA
jgi:muramoyltetrapeptide carboxypeptidase